MSLISLLLMVGCSAEPKSAGSQGSTPSAPAASQLRSTTQRFIAVSHRFEIETSADDLPTAWETTAKFCAAPRCEILASVIRNKTQTSAPYGSLSLRIVPDDLPKLADHLAKSGTVAQHITQSEDKTATVIDVEAAIKNQTAFRDRLRAMLTRSAAAKDLIEIERELARVQENLDSLATKRRVLANETEKVAVNVDFRVIESFVTTGSSSRIAAAWHESGSVLSSSIAYLITFVFAVAPWLIIIVPTLWLIVRLLRRLFRRKGKAVTQT